MSRTTLFVGLLDGFTNFSTKTVVRSMVTDNGIIYAAYRGMSSSKLLVALAIATAFSFVQPVKAKPTVQAGPSHINGDGGVPVSVPDAGSTLPLLGSALLAVAVLRRKLNR